MMDKIIKDTEYGYTEMQSAIKKLCGEYEFLRRDIIGKSVLGRDITALKIGRGEEYVLLAAAFHGSERLTTNLLLKFTEDICFALKSGEPLGGYKISRALSGRGVIIIPRVNPDGAEISLYGAASAGKMANDVIKSARGKTEKWNANARGVDINHNFNADWQNVKNAERAAGILVPGPSKFGGYHPASEPETLAVTGVCLTHNIRHALAFHSQGEVIYADCGKIKPARMQKIAEILSSSSGYEIASPEGTAVGGGFKDWFIERFSRPAFTVEIGKGENPLPVSDIESIYNRLLEMLILSIAM